ncbi:hypothetical protein HDU96_010116 [Phlyctochytrium bullatum]|nr:hypothetical protein HDU96_010116 [Phlyctochytrium bullatum]
MLINPRLAEFKSNDISPDDIKLFYNLNHVKPNEVQAVDLPYAWSNSVATLDGVLHFLDPGSCVSDIALKSVADEDSFADYRLLNGGWSMADAVLITGQILRHEPDAKCAIRFPFNRHEPTV